MAKKAIEKKSKEKEFKKLDSGKPSVDVLSMIWNIVGVLVGLAIAYHHTWYLYIQHENEMWFTNIKQVEREISFRTESGLYYSYFKQYVEAPDFTTAMHRYTRDNKTEFPNEVNILERFNIYQEFFLGVIYKIIKPKLIPIIWYSYQVFNLQMIYSLSLYATAWILSGSWVTALPAPVFFTLARFDMTRVEFTVPLRESFALPFWALQLAILTKYFKSSTVHDAKYTAGLCFASFCFAICWQFNQFVFLLQACALFGAGALDLVPTKKVKMVYLVLIFSLVMTYIFQFFNTMTPRSLVASFIPAAWIMLSFRLRKAKDGPIVSFIKLIIEIVLTIGLATVFQMGVKSAIAVEPDEHIFKFLLAKFELAETDDFDAKLYLCNGAFNFLPKDTFPRLATQGFLPAWIAVLVVGLLALLYHQFQIWSMDENGKPGRGPFSDRPEIGYHLIHSFVFFLLALSTMRMKYLWSPHAASMICLVALPDVWAKLKWRDGRFFITAALLIGAYVQNIEDYTTQTTKELEFYDPDTVELMEWGAKQPKDTVFSGSMQLNAGVRLSTWRALTNHPHYEDKRLRETTFDVYQIYGHRTPEEVLKRLGKYGTTHILVENSICYQGGSKGDNCATPDLIDLANDHLQADRKTPKVGLPERFCNEMRQNPSYSKYFQLVLENKTFRVYKLINNEKYDLKKADRQKLIDYYY